VPPGAGADAATSLRLIFMSTKVHGKNKCGTKEKARPPATGQGIQIGERWHPKELAAIDTWIANSGDKTLTRAHAIRRLVAIGLKAKGK
jgi:hypothetical protein